MIPAIIVCCVVAAIVGRWSLPKAPWPEQWRAGLAFVTKELLLFTVAGLIVLGVWYAIV